MLRQVAGALTREVRDALESLITVLWNAPAEPTATWRQLQMLLPDHRGRDLLDDPMYHAWFAYTIGSGRVSAELPRR